MARRGERQERGVYIDHGLGLVRVISSNGHELSLVFATNGDLEAAVSDAFITLDERDPIQHGASLPPLPRHLRLLI